MFLLSISTSLPLNTLKQHQNTSSTTLAGLKASEPLSLPDVHPGCVLTHISLLPCVTLHTPSVMFVKDAVRRGPIREVITQDSRPSQQTRIRSGGKWNTTSLTEKVSLAERFRYLGVGESRRRCALALEPNLFFVGWLDRTRIVDWQNGITPLGGKRHCCALCFGVKLTDCQPSACWKSNMNEFHILQFMYTDSCGAGTKTHKQTVSLVRRLVLR